MRRRTPLRRRSVGGEQGRSPDRPRVAILGTRGYPSYYGGFETLVRRLVPALIDRGWDVTVYGRPGATREDDPGLDDRAERVETIGIESRSLSALTFGASSTADAAADRPDVALIMNVANGLWLPMLKYRSVPSVLNVDGIEWERAKWGRLAKAVFRLGARLSARYSSELVYDAESIRSRWVERSGRDGVVIPYGGAVPGALPEPTGLRSGSYVLIVARFVPENTVEEFFDAVQQIAPSAPVVIVGSTGYGGHLDERAAELARTYPNVEWRGHVGDDEVLFSLWQHAGAYFHGHSVGGTNPALVQAMACGAPTVARDTVFNREVLGDSAVFVEPEPSAIAAAALSLLNDPDRQKAIATASLARAREHYDWDDVCAAYDETLRRATAFSGRGARRPRPSGGDAGPNRR